jgi:hypothetical protein
MNEYESSDHTTKQFVAMAPEVDPVRRKLDKERIRFAALVFVAAAVCSLAFAVAGCAESSGSTGGAGSDFCAHHACIDNFDNGSGYVVQCADGTWSHSGGKPGACSWHGGEG